MSLQECIFFTDRQVTSKAAVTHSARNGFLYTMERNNGQTVLAKPYLDNINWTKGIDQKTGKPLDYDPNADLQLYAGLATPTAAESDQEDVPGGPWRQQFLAVVLQPEDQAHLHSDRSPPCVDLTQRLGRLNKAGDWKGGAYKQTDV